MYQVPVVVSVIFMILILYALFRPPLKDADTAAMYNRAPYRVKGVKIFTAPGCDQCKYLDIPSFKAQMLARYPLMSFAEGVCQPGQCPYMYWTYADGPVLTTTQGDGWTTPNLMSWLDQEQLKGPERPYYGAPYGAPYGHPTLTTQLGDGWSLSLPL